jgi:hypothetical protein
MLTKDYLGEVALPLDDWFVDKQTGKERSFGFGQPGNEVSGYLYFHVTPTYSYRLTVHLLQPRLHVARR